MAVTLPEVAPGLCFHCLQPLPAQQQLSVTLGNQRYPVCCHGCQAVAQTIAAQNLLHFYQFRDTSNPLQVPLLPEELKRFEAYDDASLQQQISSALDSEQRAIDLSVEGMSCAACAWLIEQHVQDLAGVSKVRVNASTERVHIEWQPAQTKLSSVLKRIAQLGYRALPFQAAQQEQAFKQRRRYFVTRLGVAGLATMQVMMIAVALYFGVVSDLDDGLRHFLWWISLLMATPVLLYSAQPFYQNALRGIQAGRLNMDVPVSLALLSTYIASAYATITNQGEVYFESVSMFTFFLLLGRYLELLARQRAIAAANNLIKLLPAEAQRELPNGERQTVAVSQLQVGDQLWVGAGDTIPADGVLLEQAATVNESLLNGESAARLKQVGEVLLAGSINQQQPLRMRITAVQQHTVLAGIVALQDQALADKPKWVETAEKLASQFVQQVLLLAAITFLVWSWIDPSEAFWTTVAVLVATCPCALALAAPTAVTGAIHKLNKQGVIVRNADVLTKMRSVKTIFLDKTGTLTDGAFSVLQQHHYPGPFSRSQIHALVQAMEQSANHPLASPLRYLTDEQCSVTQVEMQPGFGLSASYQGQTLRLGSARWIAQWHPDWHPHLVDAQVFLANEQQVLAEFELGDRLRDGVQQTIQAWQQQGLELVLLSGDQQPRVAALAASLGIKRFYAGCLPQDKLAYLKQQQQLHPVMMIGDGLNDGPVLAQADVSVTFAQASDLARAAADIVLLRQPFAALQAFYQSALLSERILKQNVRWALLYNFAILPVAMLGYLTPYLAALGMSASSLVVLLNALRLYR